MGSIYNNKRFAAFWNERVGDDGEPYKHYVLDPIMFKLVGSFKGRSILELGCGNGYLGPRFVAQKARSVLLMDISKHNLDFAKSRCSDPRVRFIQQDATKRWKVPSGSLDIVYSNMMLNEVSNIQAPVREAFRALKRGGVLVLSVTHPAWDLYVYAQERAGVESKKLRGLGGYFHRGYAHFIMGLDGSSSTKQGGFAVEHYQRPLSDYVEAILGAGFCLKRMVEPEMTPALLKHHPRFMQYKDHPIGIILCCVKP